MFEEEESATGFDAGAGAIATASGCVVCVVSKLLLLASKMWLSEFVVASVVRSNAKNTKEPPQTSTITKKGRRYEGTAMMIV